MCSNNSYLTPPYLSSSRHHRAHTLDTNFRFPPSPSQPDFRRYQPCMAPPYQKRHARSSTLQFNPQILDLHETHDLPALNTSGGLGFGDSYIPAEGYMPSGKPAESTVDPQDPIPGLTPPPVSRAWTCDPTLSAISPLNLNDANSFPVSRSFLSFDPCSHSKAASTTQPLTLPHASHKPEWRSGTSQAAHDERKMRFYYDDLPEREHKGSRGRIGGPPKAILGGPGGKTFDEMMAEKEKSHSPVKLLPTDPPASTLAQELKRTTPLPGAEECQQGPSQPIMGKDSMLRKQTNKYNHLDLPSSTLPADSEDAKSDTPGIPRKGVSGMFRTVSDNSEEQMMPESSQRQGSADAVNNASNIMTGAFARRQLGDILKPKADRERKSRVGLRMSAKPDVSKPRLSPQDLNIFQRLERGTEQLEDECCNAYAAKEWGDHENEKLLPENKHEKKEWTDENVVKHVDVEGLRNNNVEDLQNKVESIQAVSGFVLFAGVWCRMNILPFRGRYCRKNLAKKCYHYCWLTRQCRNQTPPRYLLVLK